MIRQKGFVDSELRKTAVDGLPFRNPVREGLPTSRSRPFNHTISAFLDSFRIADHPSRITTPGWTTRRARFSGIDSGDAEK
jgi:hypothetical protein